MTTRNGTTWPNTPAGVTRSSTEPAVPPSAATTPQRRSHAPFPASSGREASADPGQHATSATMLATFAGSGATPASSSAGYETSDVIPPAVPTRPATAPAPVRNNSRAAGSTAASVEVVQ